MGTEEHHQDLHQVQRYRGPKEEPRDILGLCGGQDGLRKLLDGERHLNGGLLLWVAAHHGDGLAVGHGQLPLDQQVLGQLVLRHALFGVPLSCTTLLQTCGGGRRGLKVKSWLLWNNLWLFVSLPTGAFHGRVHQRT